MRLPDPQRVSELIREAAQIEIVPRFRNLAAGDVREKSPGEVVTAADEAMELRLTTGLSALLPGSVVVGEEGAATDSAVLDLLEGDAPAWVIDPLDGTANFAAGLPLFGTMVCLVHNGSTLAAWIQLPLEGTEIVAERGSGSWLNGQRLRIAAPARPLRVSLGTKFFPSPQKEHIEGVRGAFDLRPSSHCAADTYTRLATGSLDAALYFRLLPWDHAPGVLIHAEAGGYSALLDGRPYSPLIHSGGFLAAPDVETWERMNRAFAVPPGPDRDS